MTRGRVDRRALDFTTVDGIPCFQWRALLWFLVKALYLFVNILNFTIDSINVIKKEGIS